MKNINGMKMSILLELKERGKSVGEAIPMSEWYDTILPNYTEEEQELFLQAIHELIAEEKIECQLIGMNNGISLK